MKFNHILTIAKNTFRETIRDRILFAALIVVLAMIAFSLFIGSISIDQNIRMTVDFGVAAIYLLQMFVAIFVGSWLMYKEIDRRTFFLIIPKPIRMESIILGKALGLLGTTTVVTFTSTLALYLILFFQGGSLYFLPILLSLLFSIIESAIIIMISILFSGLTSPILATLYTIGFFLIGHSSEIMRGLIADAVSPIRIFILKAAYFLLPNLEKFNLRNDIVYEKLPNGTAIGLTVLYAVCYMIIIFLITRLSFKGKEF